MKSKTQQGKVKMRMLHEERVELINGLFGNINDLVSDLYEKLFDMEDIDKTKEELITIIKKTKLNDFKAD